MTNVPLHFHTIIISWKLCVPRIGTKYRQTYSMVELLCTVSILSSTIEAEHQYHKYKQSYLWMHKICQFNFLSSTSEFCPVFKIINSYHVNLMHPYHTTLYHFHITPAINRSGEGVKNTVQMLWYILPSPKSDKFRNLFSLHVPWHVNMRIHC